LIVIDNMNTKSSSHVTLNLFKVLKCLAVAFEFTSRIISLVARGGVQSGTALN